jgi:hypothetical protein
LPARRVIRHHLSNLTVKGGYSQLELFQSRDAIAPTVTTSKEILHE